MALGLQQAETPEAEEAALYRESPLRPHGPTNKGEVQQVWAASPHRGVMAGKAPPGLRAPGKAHFPPLSTSLLA